MGDSVRAEGRVFISYRREETAYPAGWLFDRLSDHFGRGQIFKDVDSIELGDDFVEVINTAVGSCDVLLALIGDRWLTTTDADGKRRLDDPNDFVRLEIEAALARNVRVIPILVDGARMPAAQELPSSLARLVRRQALELSPSRFDFDTNRLMKVLDRTLADDRATDAPTPVRRAPEEAADRRVAEEKPRRRRPTRALLLAGIGVAVVVAALVVVALTRDPGVILRDDFSGQASGWADVGSESVGGRYVDGAYRIVAEAGDAGEFSWDTSPEEVEDLYPTAPPNISIQVDAQRISGGSHELDGYGIFCRGDRADNGYAFILGRKGVTIGELSDGVFSDLDSADVPGLDPNDTTQLRATCTTTEQGNVHLEFAIDGNVAAAVTDDVDAVPSGTVGLFAFTVQSLSVEFDNFVVTEI
jgi:hypothetical protein